MVVTGTELVGEGCTDSGIREGCVGCCVSSVLLLFGVGSFYFCCGNLEPSASFLVAIVVCSIGANSGIGSVGGEMGTKSGGGINADYGTGD